MTAPHPPAEPLTEGRITALRSLRHRMHHLSELSERLRGLAAAEGARPLSRALEHAAETAYDAQTQLTECITSEGGFPRSLTSAAEEDATVSPTGSPREWAALAVDDLEQAGRELADAIDAPLDWSRPALTALTSIDRSVDQARTQIQESVGQRRM